MSAAAFARELVEAEHRLRGFGLSGRAAYAALCRHLAARLDLPRHLWLEGPDAPPEAGLDRLPLTGELDLFGLAYERFFPEVFKARHGQFFTPRPLVELMADLAGAGPGDRVLDPTCGSGSFLVVAHARGADVDGIEVDPELVALCRLNLKLHGADPRAVREADLFRAPALFEGGVFDEGDRWDVVMANPPFSIDLGDAAALGRANLGQGRSQVGSDELFLAACWRALRPGGRLCVLVPQTVVSSPRQAPLRAWLAARFVRRAIVSLPEGIFRPFGGTGARACVLCLERKPARLRPWAAAVVTNPGYDPARRNYHPTEPDELTRLRLGGPDSGWRQLDAETAGWDPEVLLGSSGIATGVPTVPLLGLAEYAPRIIRPAEDPDRSWTEIDLADIDKSTGEVARARTRCGAEIQGNKVGFEDGDILFARIRPALNNVAIASRPRDGLDAAMCGSAEWLRLVPRREAGFVLTAARSPCARRQLQAAGGQTRPRIRVGDLAGVAVPDPGPQARARIDAMVRAAHARRRADRLLLDRVDAAYAAFGRGELDAEALIATLEDIERKRRAAEEGEPG
ncbi:MAG: SAM-dependent DNA methyltransferase [Deltaproteobacteria bacterium]|nr:MAG: SAM-dependent DNA methyltransferase [Deltaproteobacteria bacterium]